MFFVLFAGLLLRKTAEPSLNLGTNSRSGMTMKPLSLEESFMMPRGALVALDYCFLVPRRPDALKATPLSDASRPAFSCRSCLMYASGNP